jgi:hypothetical protein
MLESIPSRFFILFVLAWVFAFAPTLFLFPRRSTRLAMEVMVRTLDSILLALALTPTPTSFLFDLFIRVRAFSFFEPLPLSSGLGLLRP